MKLPPVQAGVHFLLAALFGVAAWVQVNDIDPAVYHKPSSLDALIWFSFYLMIAVLFVVSIFRRVPVWLLVVAAIACLAEMIMTGPGLIDNLFGDDDFTMTQVSMSAEDPRVELTREFFGALIALAGVTYLIGLQRKLRSSSAEAPRTSTEEG